jgi:hypothetical protein
MNRRSILRAIPSLIFLPLLGKEVRATVPRCTKGIRLTTQDRHQSNMDMASIMYSIHRRVHGPSLSRSQLHLIHPLDPIPGAVLVGAEYRVPIRLSLGEYLAEVSFMGHESEYYIRWSFTGYTAIRIFDSVIRELSEPHLILCNIPRFKGDYNSE